MRLYPLLVRVIFAGALKLTDIRNGAYPVIMMTMMDSKPETLEMSEDCGKDLIGSQHDHASMEFRIAYVLDPMISQLVNSMSSLLMYQRGHCLIFMEGGITKIRSTKRQHCQILIRILGQTLKVKAEC